MDPSEKQLLCQQLPNLLEETDCNSKFLSVLRSRDVISSVDAETIKSIRVRQERNAKFYQIITTRKDAFKQLLCALNQTNQSGVLSLLTETNENGITNEGLKLSHKRKFQCKIDSCTSPKKATLDRKNTSIYFHIQQCSKYFSGRENYLSCLEASFKSGSTSIICESILGLGGIGKSELAKRLIAILKENAEKLGKSLSIIWLNAENESKLRFDFRTLAENKLGISKKNSSNGEKDIMTVVQEVFDYFEGRKCVFVYDNAENSAYLTNFLPSSHVFKETDSIKPSVIITSRDYNWEMESNSVINLDVFELGEAVDYVIKGLRLDKCSLSESNAGEHINRLVNRLGKFPLALTQAISYIQQQVKYDETYGVLSYITELNKNAKHLLNLKLDKHAQTSYETWNITIRKISENQVCGKEAIQLLHLLSYMSPDAISGEMFCEIIPDKQKRREAFLLLRRYSMIKISSKTAYKEAQISIHRFVQEVIRLNLRANGKEEEVLSLALRTIALNVNPINVGHVISLWNHTKLYNEMIKEYLDIPTKIVSCHFSQYRLKEASEIAELELSYLKQIGNDPTQSTFNYNVTTLKKLYCEVKIFIGEMGKPYEIYQTIITDYQTNFIRMSDEDELLYINSLKCYAHLLYNMEEYDEALEIFTKAEIKLRTGFKDKLIDIIHTQLWRDLVLCYLGKYEKPINSLIDLYKSSLSLPNFQMNFSVAHDIVYYLFYVAGKVEDAYNFCKELFNDMQNHFGKENFKLIQLQNMFANILNEKKYYEEAFQISLDCYNFCKARSVDHFEILNARKEIANALLGKGEFQQAFIILSHVISEMKDPLPRHLFDVFDTKIAMAWVLEIKGEYKQAHSYLIDAKNDLDTVLAGTPYPLHSKKVLQAICRVEAKMSLDKPS